MAVDSVIQCDGLGKSYLIGHQGTRERYSTLRDVVVRQARGVWQATQRALRGQMSVEGDEIEEFWALRDVSFEVQQGEVVGVIGRNGAGKSTLLKILSRITEPTEGRVTLRGRVASLLEVGTGFHPELTGRENIFLNGAILGMTRAEIREKFDEIVAFAEVEKFLDTPVKRYSSGMYVRLAFAVAAHLEPEILLVDEVLAVGDAEFQKKCLGKMSEVAQGGRTVLFVSHNMGAINRLCQRGLLFDQGHLKFDGDAQTATSMYMVTETGVSSKREWCEAKDQPGDDVARLIRVQATQGGVLSDTMDIRFPVDLEMIYENRFEGAQLLASYALLDSQGVFLFATADFADEDAAQPRPAGVYKSVCRVPGNLFAEGQVRVYAEVSTRQPVYQIHASVLDAIAFQVVDTGAPGSVRAGWGRPIPGSMRPMCDWETSPVPSGDKLMIPVS
jgi:lipopolysaccharide transport system ATP-binding protein